MPAKEKIIFKLKDMGYNPFQIFLIMNYDKYLYTDLFLRMSPQFSINIRKKNDGIMLEPLKLEGLTQEYVLTQLNIKENKNAIYLFELLDFKFCFNVNKYPLENKQYGITLAEMFSGGINYGLKMVLPKNWKDVICSQ